MRGTLEDSRRSLRRDLATAYGKRIDTHNRTGQFTGAAGTVWHHQEVFAGIWIEEPARFATSRTVARTRQKRSLAAILGRARGYEFRETIKRREVETGCVHFSHFTYLPNPLLSTQPAQDPQNLHVPARPPPVSAVGFNRGAGMITACTKLHGRNDEGLGTEEVGCRLRTFSFVPNAYRSCPCASGAASLSVGYS